MRTIAVLALDGVLDSSLTITLDALRTAGAFAARSRASAGIHVEVIGSSRRVTTAGGLIVPVGRTLREVSGSVLHADWLIVPGMGITSPDLLEARFAKRDAVSSLELLRRTPERTKIAAGCSSVFLLAETGMLDGRDATTTWWLAGAFRSRYPGVRLDETHMLVRDGRFLTAGSAFAQLDLVLAVIAEQAGAAVADLCSRYLLIDRRPSQARYMIPSHVRHLDETVLAAERWIDANISEPLSVTGLASALAVSPKTLARRISAATGVSPVRFLQRRRVAHAARLIETTSMTIEEIAATVGYQDGTALRKLIRREMGVTPGRLRG